MSEARAGKRRVMVVLVAWLLGWGIAQVGVAPSASAQPAGGRVSATATLSVLGGIVQHVTSGGTQAQARDGMDLALGDRVVTGPKSAAVITFLDGSTVTVQPDSDVQVKKAEITPKKSTISVKIIVGVVWARVVRLADPKSSLSLESNTATATVHDGLIGGEMIPEHFMCWTMAGPVTVTDWQGQVLMVLLPGEKTMVQPNGGNQPVPAAFSVNQSTLRVTASAGVLPLVVMDDGVRVAGFVAPTIEVNHVFGSLTKANEDGTHIVQVPAGATGPFTVVVEGVRDGAFTLTLVGSFKGKKVYEQELAGSIKKGERKKTMVTQQLDPATAAERKTAKLDGGSAAPLEVYTGPLPGKILLSPMELQAVGGM
jgi:hypothetical protein